MTQPTHDEVIAWIDDKLAILTEIENTTLVMPMEVIARASLLANRDVLERHKSTLDGVCMGCSDFTRFSKGLGAPHKVMFPCPTYTEIYNPIVSVM